MIKFGPSGNSAAFAGAGHSKTEDSAAWVKSLGLDWFEYSFGRGVNMSDEKAISLGKIFAENGVGISVHAPYYVNLANPEEENADKSFGYILNSAKKVRLMGGNRVVFHPASQGKQSREKAVALTLRRIKRLKELVEEEGLTDILFCPETMGKSAQIGTIEEITEMCRIADFFVPTVDFGHVNARECGSLKTENDYLSRLEYMINELGYEKMKHFHVHFSKIEFTSKGEVRHLTFEDKFYGPEFLPLAEALIKLKLEPIIVCESAGTQDSDSVTMQKIYRSLTT